jgi:hypothetical protein
MRVGSRHLSLASARCSLALASVRRGYIVRNGRIRVFLCIQLFRCFTVRAVLWIFLLHGFLLHACEKKAVLATKPNRLSVIFQPQRCPALWLFWLMRHCHLGFVESKTMTCSSMGGGTETRVEGSHIYPQSCPFPLSRIL